MKIYAPVKDANGVYASVRFVNGVGETNNPHLIEWFKSHGYKVPIEDSLEKCDESSQISVEKCDQVVEANETVDVEVSEDTPEPISHRSPMSKYPTTLRI